MKMKTESSVSMCILLCFLGLFTLDKNLSHAAPSNWILDTSKYNVFSGPNTGRKIIRMARSLNSPSVNSEPIEPLIRDLPW